jgi:Flp pilus assembly protein TadB
MDWAVFASVVAALAGLIAATAQAARLIGDHAWYRRWLEVLENATNDDQQLVARERIQHYVEEFAVTDRTRKKRRAALAVGGFLLVAALAGSVASAWWFSERLLAAGWIFALVGTIAYALGLYLIIWFPDQERARAREALLDEFADGRRSAPRRWWHKRIRTAD